MSYEEEDFLTQAEIKAKKKFLREEILEMHYDPGLFTWFFESRKDAEIDEWTFDELQLCVRQFKLLYRPGQTLDDINEAADIEEKSKKPKNLHQNNSSVEEKKETFIQEETKSNESKHKQFSDEKSKLEYNPRSNVSNDPLSSSEQAKTHHINAKQEDVDPEFDADILRENEEEQVESATQDKLFEISCREASETELSQCKNLEIIISMPEIIQGGVFTGEYMIYNLTTNPFN